MNKVILVAAVVFVIFLLWNNLENNSGNNSGNNSENNSGNKSQTPAQPVDKIYQNS